MNQVEDELICCVCLDLFENPVLLPCSHNLCKNCVRGLTTSSGISRRLFDCPKCRQEIRVSASLGLDSLPENTALKNIVNLVKKHKIQSTEECVVSEKKCVSHNDLAQQLYCKTCRRTICQMCYKDGHTGFGHNVGAAMDVLDEEKVKVDRCVSELKRSISSLEERHKKILKKKERISHYEKNLQKYVENDIQNLALNVSMVKMSLTSTVQQLLKDVRTSIKSDEGKCQKLLSEASDILKNVEYATKCSDVERKLEHMEKFQMQQSSFLTFQMNSYTFDPTEEQLPIIRLHGVEKVREALKGVKWVIEEDHSLERKPLPKEHRKSSHDFSLGKEAKAMHATKGDHKLAGNKCESSDSSQAHSSCRSSDIKLRTESPKDPSSTHTRSPRVDQNGNDSFRFPSKKTCPGESNISEKLTKPSNKSLADRISKSEPKATAIDVIPAKKNPGPETLGAQCTSPVFGSAFSFCCRSKYANPTKPTDSTHASCSTGQKPFTQLFGGLSLRTCTQDQANHVDSKDSGITSCDLSPSRDVNGFSNNPGSPFGSLGVTNGHNNHLNETASEVLSNGISTKTNITTNPLQSAQFILNHDENSPFRPTDFFKSMSDPGDKASENSQEPAFKRFVGSSKESIKEESSIDNSDGADCRPKLQKSSSLGSGEVMQRMLFTIGSSPPRSRKLLSKNQRSKKIT